MRIVICGGRNYSDAETLRRVLDGLHAVAGIKEIATGGAKGADQLAEEWARAVGVDSRVYLADWEQYGRSAGPRRNRVMLTEFAPDIVVSFPGGRGTSDCVRQAIALKILVYGPG